MGGFVYHLTFDLRHPVHVLSCLAVHADTDSGEATCNGLFEVGVEADLSKCGAANSAAVEILKIGRRFVLPLWLSGPFDLAVPLCVAIRAAKRRRPAVPAVASSSQTVTLSALLLSSSLVVIQSSSLLHPGTHSPILVIINVRSSSFSLRCLVRRSRTGSQCLFQLQILLAFCHLLSTLGKDLFALEFGQTKDTVAVIVRGEFAFNWKQRRVFLVFLARRICFAV